MQVFLPFPDYAQSARILDRARLGQQRRECAMILAILSGRKWDIVNERYRHYRLDERRGYENHPCCRQFKGFEHELIKYGEAICLEWKQRNYIDNMQPRISSFREFYGSQAGLPPWLGDNRFHASHRAALLYKNFDHYKNFGWQEKPELNYYWPV